LKRVKKIILKPVEVFLSYEASGGILLMFVALLSFIFANSGLSDFYFRLVNYPIGFSLGPFSISHSLAYWINDGLMVVFFFVVGLEIKRELVIGELNTLKRAAFPVIAATGGAIVPALIYAFFNSTHPDTASGWGIPMATDIAFAVGVLALFGKRVPLSLKIFLLALAIVDDLIAVLVIAIFYTEKINLMALAAAVFIFIFVQILKKLHVANYFIYFLIGIGAWIAVFASGVHATIAGVILGLMTPISLPNNPEIKPAETLVHFLHPWVAILIMPVFAFFNAGVKIDFSHLNELIASPVTLGIVVGLIIGKPIGIYFSTLIAKKLKWISLPIGITMPKILAVGFLAGIGFTMSLFIAGLSFKTPAPMDAAKLGILLASVIAALLGSFSIYLAVKVVPKKEDN
jgi:NhaA family Na+:H+ antiporter